MLLQAMREDPPLDARCRDKFLVQSIAITPEKDSSNIATVVGHLSMQNVDQGSQILVVERRKDGKRGYPGAEDSCCLFACFWTWH